MHWSELAACRGMPQQIFFPVRGEVMATAKAVCDRCPVQKPCLDYALQFDPNRLLGCWGGSSPKDRRRILRGLAQRRSH